MKLKMGIGEQIKEDQAVALDLLEILTYTSSIATANIGRDKIFELASQQDGITAKHLKKIYLLVKNYGYEYTKACKIVANEAHHPALKSFLMRLSSALATGEDESKFLRGEADRMVEVYTNKYESDVDSLQKWTDAYSAILVSVTLVIAIFLISTMLYSMGDLYSMSILSGILLCFIAFIGVYALYRAAPYEDIVHSLAVKSKEQEMAKRLSIFILPAGCITSFILLIAGVETWIIFLTISIFFAPIGIIGMRDSKKIEKADEDISSFLKSLGTTAGTTQSTLTTALERMDRKSVASLEEHVNRLHKRLQNGVNPTICWYNFVGETGSELINKSTRVFIDAITLGGDPAKIGEIVSKSSLGIALLRIKRKFVSAGFMNLTIPLHGAMSGVLMFIYGIMFSFSNAVGVMMAEHSTEVEGAASTGMTGGMAINIGGSTDLVFIAYFVTFVIFVLTIASAFASKVAAGGSNYTLCYYLSVMFFVSAVVTLVVPIMADKMFTLE